MKITDMLTLEGQTQSIEEWALDYGITPGTITARIRSGMKPEKAITKPMFCQPGQKLSEPKRGGSRELIFE